MMVRWAREGQRRVFADVFVCSFSDLGVRDGNRELVKACFVRRRRMFHELYRPADACVGGCGWRGRGMIDVLVVAALDAFLPVTRPPSVKTLGRERRRPMRSCKLQSAVKHASALVIAAVDHLHFCQLACAFTR